MSKSISIDQSHAVIQTLANNVDWSVLDADILQNRIIANPKEAGKQFTTFLKRGGKVIGEEPKVIDIDRSFLFHPAIFIEKGWTIEEQDERSLTLTQIDLTEIMFETTLQKMEKSIKGEDKLKRLKAMDCIRLDAGVLKTFWHNQHLIPLKWKEQTNGKITYILFDGTVLRSSDNRRFVQCLWWTSDEWDLGHYWLDHYCSASHPSAVLASSTVASETSVS